MVDNFNVYYAFTQHWTKHCDNIGPDLTRPDPRMDPTMSSSEPGAVWLSCLVEVLPWRSQQLRVSPQLKLSVRLELNLLQVCRWTNTWRHSATSETITPHPTVAWWLRRHTGAYDRRKPCRLLSGSTGWRQTSCNMSSLNAAARVVSSTIVDLFYTVSQIKRGHFSFRHNFCSC